MVFYLACINILLWVFSLSEQRSVKTDLHKFVQCRFRLQDDWKRWRFCTVCFARWGNYREFIRAGNELVIRRQDLNQTMQNYILASFWFEISRSSINNELTHELNPLYFPVCWILLKDKTNCWQNGSWC